MCLKQKGRAEGEGQHHVYAPFTPVNADTLEGNAPGPLQPSAALVGDGSTESAESQQKGYEPTGLVHPWAEESRLCSQAWIQFQEGIPIICTFQGGCYQTSGHRGVSESRSRPIGGPPLVGVLQTPGTKLSS